ncbi:EutN/CcmL family microcompartment protein [Brevibacillus laterosporus]|uniref:EutN/CcmL family microcompartment protein n=1 Tax=Brevibacillus laterosporus TaxID=1465 RepID=UPI001EF28E41|nr:EutN/CcmL family microcompartment protein [Brevibacillus laterosporus]MCG7317484.1 EutN/CcmL family microcompartment protein [Brevibacillus laterosporus]MED1789011.1 EutN/CcmL family microcompartment protein [Brevibacillus laterosporus]
MIIGKVIGNVWATRKDAKLDSLKLMIVSPSEIFGGEPTKTFVAADGAGSGIGDLVLVTKGGSARAAFDQVKAPIDATIVGIIDSYELRDSCKEDSL